MKTYLIGTTLECLNQILEDGRIRVSPPHRVWDNYSEDYVYMIPSEIHNEDEDEEESWDSLMVFALEQATFALGKLKSTMRVVIEVENIDETKLDEDPDGKGIYAVRYPEDIPSSDIRAVHFVKGEHRSMLKVQQLAALYWFMRDGWTAEKVWALREEFDFDEDATSEIFAQMEIPFIETIDLETLSEESTLQCLSETLNEEYNYFAEWNSYSVGEYIRTHLEKGTTTYYTATTMDALKQIVEDGYIRTSPAKRVWPDLSGDYVYLIPSSHRYETRETLFRHAVSQSCFSLARLGGSGRVVLEIEGIFKSLLSEDEGASLIRGLKYSADIPVESIKKVHVLASDEEELRDAKRLFAIHMFHQQKWTPRLMEDLFEDHLGDEQEFFAATHLPDAELLGVETLMSSKKMASMFRSLRDRLIDECRIQKVESLETLGHTV